MASVKKRGTKWLVRWRDPDGTERTRTCPNKATADTLRREVEEAHALGRRWAPSEAAPAPALSEAIEAYAMFRAPRKRASSLTLDDLSASKFVEFVKRKHRKRAVDVSDLNLANLRDFDTALRTGGLAVNTCNTYTLAVRRLWAWASAQPEYEAHMKRAPEAAVLAVPTPAWSPPHAPTFEECDKAIDATDRTWLRKAFVLMRFTGLRQGQAMRLVWDDFDLREGLLTVRPELGKTIQERSGRTVPISAHLVHEMAGWGRREGYVVAPELRARRVPTAQANAAWQAAGVRADVWEGHPCHAFRYAFTSGLAQLGANEEAVERLVGHAVAGARANYLDPRWALKLREAVDLLPALGTGQVENIEAWREG